MCLIQLQFAKVGAFFETEGFCDPWTITAASCRLMLRIFTVISRSCLVTLEWEWVMVVVNSLQTLCWDRRPSRVWHRWCIVRCIDVTNVFYVFYSGHVFFTFLTFFYFANVFIFKNVHWKYRLKSLLKQRKQIGSVWLFFFVPMLEFPYRPIYWQALLGGIMPITSIFTIGPFVPCTPFAKS